MDTPTEVSEPLKRIADVLAGATEDEVVAALEAVRVPIRQRQSPSREVSRTPLPLPRVAGSCVIHSEVERI